MKKTYGIAYQKDSNSVECHYPMVKTVRMEKKLRKDTELYLTSLNGEAYNNFIEKHPFPKDEIISDMMTYGVAITHTDSNGNTRVVKIDTDEGEG